MRGALSHRNRGLSDSEVRGNRQNRSRRKIQGSFLPFHRPLFVTNRMAGITGASGIPPLASARTSGTNRSPGHSRPATPQNRSLGFSPGTNVLSSLKSPCFSGDGAEQECSGHLFVPRVILARPHSSTTPFFGLNVKCSARCENAFEPRNAPLAEASKGEPLAEANGCCPAGGHRTGARWFPMVARGSRRADAVDHCDLLPAEHPDWQQDDSGGPTSPTPAGPYRPPPPPRAGSLLLFLNNSPIPAPPATAAARPAAVRSVFRRLPQIPVTESAHWLAHRPGIPILCSLPI